MGNFTRLPSEIALDILTRLPTESVLDCKLVCQQWRNLVCHNPTFSRLHLTRLNQSENSGKIGFLVFNEIQIRQLHYFEYNEKHDDETPIASIRRFNLTLPFTASSYYKIIGSVNGLVCLYGYYRHSKSSHYCICNPVTREWVILPSNERDFGYTLFSSGFGYLPLNKEYKVVELYNIEPGFLEVAVYTLGSRKGWRNVGRISAKSIDTERGVFVNGALYWLDRRRENILVFDLVEEKFGEHISIPPLPKRCMWNKVIKAIGGVLYYNIRFWYKIDGPVHSDFWLLKGKNDICGMNEQVEQEPLGWSKVFNFPVENTFAFTKNGNALCLEKNFFGIYDAITSTLKELVSFRGFGQVFPHNNTLGSLKDIEEEGVKVMESAETEEAGAVISQQNT